MAVFKLDGIAPSLGADAWVADSAEVIGRVALGEGSSVWPGAVIRGDGPDEIRVGAGSNIQENAVLHCDPGQPLTVGTNVTVGHLVMLHGCTIGDGSLVGIGAIVLNGARIGNNCLVGAGALVTEGKVFADGMLIVGSPAKAVRELSAEQIEDMQKSAGHYQRNAARFRSGLEKIS
ncbi:MAG: gamma carbonic anhydrase family protein [Polaromonas sp.]|nr:gamma carbonic anhydrase family protein [Polaromonas sp.]